MSLSNNTESDTKTMSQILETAKQRADEHTLSIRDRILSGVQTLIQTPEPRILIDDPALNAIITLRRYETSQTFVFQTAAQTFDGEVFADPNDQFIRVGTYIFGEEGVGSLHSIKERIFSKTRKKYTHKTHYGGEAVHGKPDLLDLLKYREVLHLLDKVIERTNWANPIDQATPNYDLVYKNE